MCVQTVGVIAFAITLTYTMLGLPLQIRQNYFRQTMQGQSLLMNVILFHAFLSWVVYGYLKFDWYVVGSNAPGAVGVGIVLFQFWLYWGAESSSGRQ